MLTTIRCPNPDCGASYRVVEEHLGRVARCKRCGETFPLVPATKGAGRREAREDWPLSPGRYRISRLLGRGGMGSVYLAHDGQLDRPIALKVPHRSVADDPTARERFLREARAAARLRHPNLCPIFDVGEVDGRPYLTMPYIEGATLASRISADRPWDAKEAADVVRVLALALGEAHRQGVIHRDLKPANIMIGGRDGPIIMDFGLARRVEGLDPTLTAEGAILGTPSYMSPEQVGGGPGSIGPRSDVYSLGVVLYELLTGRPPFTGSVAKVLGMIAFAEPRPPSTSRPGLDPRLEAACLKAMAKRPEDRHASMDEFAEALTKASGGAADPPPDPPGTAPARRRMALRAALTGTVVASVLGLSLVLVAGRSGRGPKEAGGDRPGPPTIHQAQGKPSGPDEAVLANSLGMRLRLIPAGSFDMGSDESDPDARDEEKVAGKKHRVRLTRPFYLGETEVTVGQFRRFVEATRYEAELNHQPSGGRGWDATKEGFGQGPHYSWASVGFPRTEDHPVTNVTWNDASAFCDWLGRLEGRRYRLPTEAEWEYACRAGRPSRYYPGDDPETLAGVGNVADAMVREKFPSLDYALRARDGYVFTAPVGSFSPNAFGLHDMHGNVWEWCGDWFDPGYYTWSPADDPLNSAESEVRVYRGGDWSSLITSCRSANRGRNAPFHGDLNIGFRVALAR